MDALPGVDYIRGDFGDEAIYTEVLSRRSASAGMPDLVLSDMAPNISGNRSVDQPRAMYLAELALDLAGRVLAAGRRFVMQAVPRRRLRRVRPSVPAGSFGRCAFANLLHRGRRAGRRIW